MYELLFYFWHFVEGMWVCSASAWCGRPSFCSVSSFITAKMAPQKWVWVPSFCSTWQPWGLPLVSDFVEALFCFFAGFLICNYKMAVPNPTRSIGGGILFIIIITLKFLHFLQLFSVSFCRNRNHFVAFSGVARCIASTTSRWGSRRISLERWRARLQGGDRKLVAGVVPTVGYLYIFVWFPGRNLKHHQAFSIIFQYTHPIEKLQIDFEEIPVAGIMHCESMACQTYGVSLQMTGVWCLPEFLHQCSILQLVLPNHVILSFVSNLTKYCLILGIKGVETSLPP